MTNIKKYIGDLEKGQATAERVYKQRKAIWERAVAAHGKAQLFESTWKEYCNRNDAIDKSASAINDSLFRAAKYGDHVVGKTDKANQAVELLTYDVRDIACQAEYLTKMLEEFATSVNTVLGKDAKAGKCIEDFAKTIPDVSKFSLEALDQSLELVKVTSWVQESIGGDCGVNARVLELMAVVKACGFLEGQDPDSDIAKQTKNLRKKYPCTITDADQMVDDACGTKFYKPFAALEPPSCINDDKTDFGDYYSKTKTNCKKSEAKVTAARNWLNCAEEAKNEALANYNACKAAYELALEAQKC